MDRETELARRNPGFVYFNQPAGLAMSLPNATGEQAESRTESCWSGLIAAFHEYRIGQSIPSRIELNLRRFPTAPIAAEGRNLDRFVAFCAHHGLQLDPAPTDVIGRTRPEFFPGEFQAGPPIQGWTIRFAFKTFTPGTDVREVKRTLMAIQRPFEYVNSDAGLAMSDQYGEACTAHPGNSNAASERGQVIEQQLIELFYNFHPSKSSPPTQP